MIPKQDRSKPRTPEEVQRRYGKRVNEVEVENKEQSKDISGLRVKIEQIIATLTTIDEELTTLSEEYEELDALTEEMGADVVANTLARHSHSNKQLLDDLKQDDIDKWNNQFTGNYVLLAENITLNQTIDRIDEYNLILLQINNTNRYIPCFKYENSYKGINITKDPNVDMEEISITIQNKVVTNIVSTNNILKIIGIF